ncbi:MAG: hypothetical protein JEZ06_11920 [Anaerolineaceae bacterium]|nr:hypothetical protein [Anaerolineaceae bacterium]
MKQSGVSQRGYSALKTRTATRIQWNIPVIPEDCFLNTTFLLAMTIQPMSLRSLRSVPLGKVKQSGPVRGDIQSSTQDYCWNSVEYSCHTRRLLPRYNLSPRNDIERTVIAIAT